MQIALPFPPSVNGLFGGGSGQKRFKTKEYKAWLASCPPAPAFKAPVPCRVVYQFCFPDRRARDLSNYIKAPEDWLVSNGILPDDNWQIVTEVLLVAGGVSKPGCVRISFFPATGK